ncbi:MAG: hypothetical protein D3914_00435 [Candidatus Electrothrix sp. LOE2]|nr:hypothetical protein [Candidatus Electrothrix sp. LOE2]
MRKEKKLLLRCSAEQPRSLKSLPLNYSKNIFEAVRDAFLDSPFIPGRDNVKKTAFMTCERGFLNRLSSYKQFNMLQQLVVVTYFTRQMQSAEDE